ncbi:MAG: M28 family peptidase [Clostridiales Family XIII bacterium]|jgi:hypothetical protein|nr:M28 family peptidase [Clostridiales Family XIII bacterium]
MPFVKKWTRVVAICAIVAVAAVTLVFTMQPEEEEPPVRAAAPNGYADFAVAVDPDFSKTVSSQLAELGDDPVLGFRGAGSPAEKEAADLLAQTMRDIGLENVTVDKAQSDGWTFGGATILYKTAGGISTTAALGGYQTDVVASDERVPIAYLGKGTAADYDGIDVEGKLVLIDIDQENEWWINYPAYQAHLKGARAVIACSVMPEAMEERIGSQDICGDADAPALAISAGDSRAIRDAIKASGYESGGVRQIDVILNADSRVVKNKGTQNVWGEIPGKTKDSIMFIAHYDGYYHSFYDDAAGVGIVLGIAKAMREGGIKPEKTFRFVLHGAEEWGKSGTEADWATGAYEQIVYNRPEWAESGFALFNVDSGYPLKSMKSFSVNAPDELRDFVSSSISSFGDRGALSISPDISPPSTYREDFIYNASGIPTFATDGGEGDAQYFESMYHSSADRLEVGGYSVDGVRGMSRYLGYAALMLDGIPIRPLVFANRMVHFRDTLNAEEGGDTPSKYASVHLIANADRAAETANKLDTFISRFNADYALELTLLDPRTGGQSQGSQENLDDMKKRAKDINSNLFKIYREMQDRMLKLDRNLEAGFANEGIQQNLACLESAKMALQSGDMDTALGELSEIESVYSATAFDKETCDYFSANLIEKVKGTWAEGRVVSEACYADDVVRSLLGRPENGEGGYAVEIGMIDKLIEGQAAALTEIYNGQEESLALLIDSMNELLDTYSPEEETEV